MEGLKSTVFEAEEQRVAWEGLASSCAPPLKRFGAFAILGLAAFAAAMTAVILLYNLFGEKAFVGQGVAVPHAAFYLTLAGSAALTTGGYTFWLLRCLRSYRAFAGILRRGGLDPKRPTASGLGAYSDEQLLSLRSRYERMLEGDRRRKLFERLFGFERGDSFSLGPLSALPGTFEMNALRVEWETNLILRSSEPMPPVSWRKEGRLEVLPRQLDDTRKLLYVLNYTTESVRVLKRRYGHRPERWHVTVPDGKLWNAIRDHEQARRVRATLNSRLRG